MTLPTDLEASLLARLKQCIHAAMLSKGWRKADLARALGKNPRQIDRLFDPNHATPAAALEQAIKACGKRFRLKIVAKK